MQHERATHVARAAATTAKLQQGNDSLAASLRALEECEASAAATAEALARQRETLGHISAQVHETGVLADAGRSLARLMKRMSGWRGLLPSFRS